MVKEKIQIGRHEVEAFYDEDPIDGCRYTVEADGQSANSFSQVFFLPKLQGISAELFPESVELNISNVRCGFRYIHTIYVRKLNGICTVRNLMMLDFDLWDMPESLGSFVDRYVGGLRNSQRISEVYATKGEYGFYIYTTMPIGSADDIYTQVTALEELQESTFRKLLVPANDNSRKRYGEDRMHWWIRYVIVPLAGSGAVAAVLAKYLLR